LAQVFVTELAQLGGPQSEPAVAAERREPELPEAPPRLALRVVLLQVAETRSV